jgi:hypothetical protein
MTEVDGPSQEPAIRDERYIGWQRRVRRQPTITFRLPNHRVLERIDQHAAEAGIDRSGYIRRALLRAMDSDETLEDVYDLDR